MLRTRRLSIGYAARTVLSDVDLDVHAGEFWFLLGPNGSGKTTLLKTLLGLLPPQSGELTLHAELASRERLGFVPQRCELSPSLPTTVREFVRLGFVGSGVPRRDRVERLAWALERAGLKTLERAAYWSLSGGQRQRALVARALVRRPRLMLLDEPTEGLDVASESAVLQTLDDLHRSERMTLLCVTHRLAIAARHATDVALFDAGRVLAGPRESILRRAEIERIFGIAVDLGRSTGPPPAGRGASGTPSR